MMRFFATTVSLTLTVALLLACSVYQKQTPAGLSRIEEQRAITIANREMIRRKITLPDETVTSVEPGRINVEVGPDIPIYAVKFYMRNKPKSRPLYIIGVNRQTGAIEDFTDTQRLIPANH
jgi:hypothetical protein